MAVVSPGLDLAGAAQNLAGATRRGGGFRPGDRLRGQGPAPRPATLADPPAGPHQPGTPWPDPKPHPGGPTGPRAELDRLTGRLQVEVPPYCRRVTDLADYPWPPVEVVEVEGGGFRVQAPGRVAGSTTQSAAIYRDRRSAEATAGALRSGMVLAETQAVAARVAALGGGVR